MGNYCSPISNVWLKIFRNRHFVVCTITAVFRLEAIAFLVQWSEAQWQAALPHRCASFFRSITTPKSSKHRRRQPLSNFAVALTKFAAFMTGNWIQMTQLAILAQNLSPLQSMESSTMAIQVWFVWKIQRNARSIAAIDQTIASAVLVQKALIEKEQYAIDVEAIGWIR